MSKYHLVDTKEKLAELDKILMDGEIPRFSVLAYDTETNGLIPDKSVLIGFSISFDRFSGYYVPILRWIPDTTIVKKRKIDKEDVEYYPHGHLKNVWTQKIYDEFVTQKEFILRNECPFLISYLERWLSKTKLIMHNAAFDLNMTLANTGIDLTAALLADTILLTHVVDENRVNYKLKRLIEDHREFLGINPHALAAMEKKELAFSILKNGGEKDSHVWRADLEPQFKYGASDTFFTFGLWEANIQKLFEERGEEGLQWFFEDEVMPVCKEVVVPMKRRGVFIDVAYFEKIKRENELYLEKLEDEILEIIKPHLKGFKLAKTIDETISQGKLIDRMIELESLEYPTLLDKKTGTSKPSTAKAAIKKAYEKDPHWLWGYLLGTDELRYSEKKVAEIKQELFHKQEGRKTAFNLGSRFHLVWLFCDALGIEKELLPTTKKSSKEKPSYQMDADIIEELILPKFPWVSKLLLLKRLEKIQSTYVLPAIELNIDGWLFMDMKQYGTKSGRFACSGGYNLQTLPKADSEEDHLKCCSKCKSTDVRRVEDTICITHLECNACKFINQPVLTPSAIKQGFIAPPGYKIVNADYSSLEPRVFSVESGESKLKEIYWKGLDMYSKMYVDIFDKKGEYSADPKAPNYLGKIAKAKRTWIKPVCLGIPYGANEGKVATLIGAMKEKRDRRGLVKDSKGQPIMVPDIEEGKRVRDAYLDAYPNLKAYMERQENMAIDVGYVKTKVGRIRHLPEAKIIGDILNKSDIDPKDLADAPAYLFGKGPNVDYVSFRGARVFLSIDMLNEISEKLDIKTSDIAANGYWKFIRHILKENLNQAKNTPIQGMAGHVTNHGMLDTSRLFKQNNIDGWVFLQVHDEISSYVREDQAEQAALLQKQGMEKNKYALMLDVEMIAEPIICDNLKQSK